MIDYIRRETRKRMWRVMGSLRKAMGLVYRSPLTEADVFELVRDRSVAMVGNARSLAEWPAGALIDAHDIVIRFNAAPLPHARSHGTRTTAIATSIELEEPLMAERAATHLFFMSPRPRYLPGWMARHPKFFLYPIPSHEALSARVALRPTTGLMMIDVLHRSACRNVGLFGFDFFQSRSLSGGQTLASTPHNYAAEKAYVDELIEKDPRFKLYASNC